LQFTLHKSQGCFAEAGINAAMQCAGVALLALKAPVANPGRPVAAGRL